jgi:predicted aspartyl protease
VRLACSWIFLIVLALAAPAAAQPATTVVETVRDVEQPDPHAITEDIAFRIQRDRMTVPVRLSGKGPYRFLVDTGADRTAVSTALVTELGLSSGPTATLHSITGVSQVRTANVPTLELTHNRVRSVQAPVLERAHMGADGILGVDSLRSQRVIFDFRTRLISIVPSKRRMTRDEDGTIVVTGKLRRGHLIVTSAKANGVPLTVVLDTGSEMTLGNAALRARLEARRKLNNPEIIEMTSVTGQKLVGEAFYLKRVDLGEVTLRNLVIMFSDAPIFSSLNLEDRPAVLLGMNAMRAFEQFSIDFARKQLRMVVPQQSSRGSMMVAAGRD